MFTFGIICMIFALGEFIGGICAGEGLGAILIIGSFITAFISYVSFKSAIDEKKAKNLQQLRMDSVAQGKWIVPCHDFYTRCQQANISTFTNPTNMKKAKMIIEDILRENSLPSTYASIYCTKEKLDNYFKQGKQLYTAEQNKEIERKKEAEQLEQQRLNTPINAKLNDLQQSIINFASCLSLYRGNKKRIQWLTELLKVEQKKFDKMLCKLYDLEQEINDRSKPVEWEKPVDWAIVGGLSQAIGGPAAGVMAAMEAQESNAGVVQRNLQRLENNAKLLASAKNEKIKIINEKERQIKVVEQAKANLDKKKYKLDFDTVSASELFANLELLGTANYDKDTLAVTVDVKNNFTPPEIEGASTPLVVDGVLIAKVICRNILVDSVKILLPVNGLKKDESSQITSYTEYRLPNMSEKYTVEFEPLKLWIMER